MKKLQSIISKIDVKQTLSRNEMTKIVGGTSDPIGGCTVNSQCIGACGYNMGCCCYVSPGSKSGRCIACN